MRKTILKNFWRIMILMILISLGSCNAISVLGPTQTPTPTSTTIPPTPTSIPTDTPQPTATNTEVPTEIPTVTLPPLPTFPPTATATLSTREAILVYYINKEQAGQYGCGESLWYLKTAREKSTNLIDDITYALNTILAYHSETIGDLYNPGYASSLAVSNVLIDQSGKVVVNLSGTYVPTKERCDGSRFKDQLIKTVKQFPGITSVNIFINGFSIGDVISRK